ncbi:hypothetical protein ACFWBV_04515 [Streptomyces sp. NPDC060030]|uniref:hypothetical protein n=1 Tax=Streptomyces sp. NPDC060030 TaxID=3347042 RepID=UPI00367FB3FB
MIILDTNILRAGPETETTDFLKMAQVAGVEVGIPSVALEELVARHVNPSRSRHERALEARAKSMARTSWAVPRVRPAFEGDQYARFWRKRYRRVGVLLLADAAVLHKALVREMHALPPCRLTGGDQSTGGPGTGARSAAIWLTATSYAHKHPDETVYFLSDDTSVFGDGVAPYPQSMSDDLRGVEDRFVHLTGVDQLAGLLARETEPDRGEVGSVLRSRATAEMIARQCGHRWAQRARKAFASSRFECTVADAEEPAWAEGWLSEPRAWLKDVGEMRSYDFGGQEQCSVKARWTMVGAAQLRHDQAQLVGCSWETHILVDTTRGEPEPTLLRSAPLRPVSRRDLSRVPFGREDVRSAFLDARNRVTSVRPAPWWGGSLDARPTTRLALDEKNWLTLPADPG